MNKSLDECKFDLMVFPNLFESMINDKVMRVSLSFLPRKMINNPAKSIDSLSGKRVNLEFAS